MTIALAAMTSGIFQSTSSQCDLWPMNAVIELSAIEMDYNEKFSKAKSDEFSAMSSLNVGEGEVAKLENQFSNVGWRASLDAFPGDHADPSLHEVIITRRRNRRQIAC